MPLFENRYEAGRQLAEKLGDYADREDVVVLGLPRGGVPVAYEVAGKLHAPLDVFIVRKLGVPGREELAMGAIASGGVRVLNEEVVRSLRIPQELIEAVAERTIGAIDWLAQQPQARGLRLGTFGSSTGAAAALIAAAERPERVQAVVSRGGRPDLAASALPRVQAPTLLIVGELDTGVIELNRQAMHQMDRNVQVELRTVPGATHLFEEPGTLERVAEMTRDWFRHFLAGSSQPDLS